MDLTAELRTDRLVIRPWRADDAAALNAEVAASHEHLVPFMAWASLPPMTIDERVAWIEKVNSVDMDDPAASVVLGILDHGGTVVGSTGYHLRVGAGGLEIGYWIGARYEGIGYATESTRALTVAGLSAPGIDRIEIHHDVTNAKSRRVPEKLGYTLVGEINTPPRERGPAETGRLAIWRITSAEWQAASLQFARVRTSERGMRKSRSAFES